jgi:putative hydrolase of the HAD superfamily
MAAVETVRGLDHGDDAALLVRCAVLVDFGGVMTTSVLRAFEEFGELLGAPAGLVLDLLSHDVVARGLLVDSECGRIDADTFDRGFAERLRVHGVQAEPEGLSQRMQAGLFAMMPPCG